MTATSLNGLRNGSSGMDLADERMDQIRELLVGDTVREFEHRLSTMEVRIRELEDELARRVEALDMRLEALSGEVTGERRAAFDELSKGINDLGQRIKQISRA
ncbi:MAG: hypothetical protein AAFV45_10605 [Pseudomonadota bacterium]